ncbi:hypothetical protein [Nostoc sp. TCL26-01]|uniref:hypothetical protein n=1 Tax=Nostoc sp. TCL26-01 TaxID=2576904 RepID=UPI0015BDC2F1|nr:hypothetical protein [Nostoc sp. TCL26-01]QLE54806.1 hypothetical protein FD725_04330 [Nostoc sp. TCL26-01]
MKIADTYTDKWAILRQLVIVLSPLILGILEIWHPLGVPSKSAFDSILPQVDWWLTLHLLQVPLFGLVALAVFLMVKYLRGLAARISRMGMAFFIVFYTSLDAITGIAGGMLIRSARNLPPNVQSFVSQQVNLLFFDPIIGGSTLSVIGILGAGGWLVGVTAAAIALAQVGVDRLSVILLMLAAILFSLSHTPPTGPLGLMFFFLAVVRIDPRVWNEPK